jgi:hypothetical protein
MLLCLQLEIVNLTRLEIHQSSKEISMKVTYAIDSLATLE